MTVARNDIAERRQRHLEGLKLHEIEGNSLTPEEIAMFERFDREGFTDDQCLAYITQHIKNRQEEALAAE